MKKILVLSWIRNRLRWRCTLVYEEKKQVISRDEALNPILISSAELASDFLCSHFSFTNIHKIFTYLLLKCVLMHPRKEKKKSDLQFRLSFSVCGIIRKWFWVKFRSACDKFLYPFGAQQKISTEINSNLIKWLIFGRKIN